MFWATKFYRVLSKEIFSLRTTEAINCVAEWNYKARFQDFTAWNFHGTKSFPFLRRDYFHGYMILFSLRFHATSKELHAKFDHCNLFTSRHGEIGLTVKFSQPPFLVKRHNFAFLAFSYGLWKTIRERCTWKRISWKRRKKLAFSNENGYVWTGPQLYTHPATCPVSRCEHYVTEYVTLSLLHTSTTCPSCTFTAFTLWCYLYRT